MANEEIPDEQIESLKKNLIEQVNNNSEATEEQKQGFKQKIESMNKEEFVEFLKSQGIINDSGEVNQGGQAEGGGSGGGQQQCIFCSIVDQKVDSYVLYFGESAISVLDINPISEGHSLVIPKTHGGEVPQEARDIAEKISGKIKQELNPKEVKTEEQTLFGHKVIALIPVYDENTLKNERQQASKEYLEGMLQKLYIKEESSEDSEEISEPEEEKEPITDKNTKLPKRFP